MKIKHLTRNEIDTTRWDQTIQLFPPGFPYAYSWYLDCVAGGKWSALVEEGYRYVMPLVWNKKIPGIKQVYQPLLSQQLGVFGDHVDSDIVRLFIQSIPSEYRYIQMCLHGHSGDFEGKSDGLFKNRTNLIIELNHDYEEIQAHYSKSLKWRIKKAQENNKLTKTVDVGELVGFYKRSMRGKLRLKESNYSMFEGLFRELIERKCGSAYVVEDNNSNIGCMAFFIETDKRIINIFGTSNDEGKKINSMHYLIDQVIQIHAGQDKLFDFEGSELKGVSDFFRSFGSIEDNYMEYQKDQLPFWAKMLKHRTIFP